MFFLPESNGPAYKKEELRFGPPLDYVGEKLRHAVESAHANFHNIFSFVPTNLSPQPQFNESAPVSIKNDMLVSSASQTLHYTVVAYLALYNMLGSANVNGTVEHIASKSTAELKKWLDLVEREGSVLSEKIG